MEELPPEHDDNDFISKDVQVKHCIVASVDHSGSSSFCHTLSDWQLLNDKGEVEDDKLFTHKNKITYFNPLEYDMSKGKLYLSLIDVGNPLMDKAGVEEVISLMPDISCVIICVKLSRWGRTFAQTFLNIINFFKSYNINPNCIIPCFTHADFISEMPGAIMGQ